MGHQCYPYRRFGDKTQYTFTSVGKYRIEKAVIFEPTPVDNIFNLGFGDLLANGIIDDTVNSNNGDIIKVLSTIIQIVKEFTIEYPHAKVSFTGSTPGRTAVYSRIMKTHYQLFSNEFIISTLLIKSNELTELTFDATTNEEYFGFFIQRIN